jgi:exopolysaccharide production protein ExoZ
MVVFHHAYLASVQQGGESAWIERSGLGILGAAGVDLFFVISGFIMVHTTGDKVGVAAALQFLEKRVRRIYPVYWFWTLVLVVLWAFGIALKSRDYSLWFILGSFLLIPVFNGKDYHPVLDQGWTLSFEMLFYLVFATAIWLSREKLRSPVVGLSFVVLFLIGRYVIPPSGLAHLTSDPIIFEFLLGVLAGNIVRRMSRETTVKSFWSLPLILGLLGGALLLASLLFDHPPATRCIFWGIPSFLIVLAAALTRELRFPPLLVYLGDASYSIYLTHGFCTMAYAVALRRIGVVPPHALDLATVIVTLATIPITAFSYTLVERRISNLLAPSRNRAN